MTTLGPQSVLSQPAIGFLCSSKAQSTAILPCLDWAAGVAKGETAVMSTFHSELERAVLDVLLRGRCPIILVLARRMYRELPEHLRPAYDAGRLLIVSLSEAPRITRPAAQLCNEYICQHSNRLHFGYVSPDSSLRALAEAYASKIT